MIMGLMRSGTACVFLVLIIVLAATAWGQSGSTSGTVQNPAAESAIAKSQQQEPINIIADRLEVDNKAHRAQFIGHVKAQQGDATLYSDNLIIIYEPGKPHGRSPTGNKEAERFLPGGQEGEKIEKIIAGGNVSLIQGNRTAEGEHAVFFSAERKVVLTGNPIIRQGKDHISGDRVTVFLDKEVSIVEGKDNSRVQDVIYPKKGLKGPPGEKK